MSNRARSRRAPAWPDVSGPRRSSARTWAPPPACWRSSSPLHRAVPRRHARPQLRRPRQPPETILRQTTIVAIAALAAPNHRDRLGRHRPLGRRDHRARHGRRRRTFTKAGSAPPSPRSAVARRRPRLRRVLNGLLVTRLRVGHFTVTLGTMLRVRGGAKGLAHDQKIDAPSSWLNELLARLPRQPRLAALFPAGVWLLLSPGLRGRRPPSLHAPRPPYLRRRLQTSRPAARFCGIPESPGSSWRSTSWAASSRAPPAD